MKRLVLTALLLATFLSLPVAAQLQYFGYVGAAEDDLGLNMTKGFTNFAHVSTRASVTDPFVKQRVTAMAQKGIKATIDLGLVLWCDYDHTNRYRELCFDWEQRWADWKAFNASILTSDKVLAFGVLDEPFNRDANMTHHELATARVKADLPWAKLWMVEAACVIYLDNCGYTPGARAFQRYQGTLPSIDWIGIDSYGIYPKTDPTFQNARSMLRSRFPGKKWLYVMDGYWNPGLHGQTIRDSDKMGLIARDWYDVARADSNAVLLGVFAWWGPPEPGSIGSKDFNCFVLAEHVLIGRAITGKARLKTSLPIGRLESIAHGTGVATGWACDPDGTMCESPRVDLQMDGGNVGTAYYYSRNDYVVNAQCGAGVAYRFRQGLTDGFSGRRITAYARDLDVGGITLPSNCPENPACIFFTKNSEPKGYMEAISPTGVAAGWACDPDAPHVSNKVRLITGNGTLIGVYTTNLGSEQAVADECGGGYTHRFSTQLPSWARYNDIYAYSQDLVSGEAQIPWLCEQGWFCSWW